MARGYALAHGKDLQGNNSSFAKSLALDFERAKGAAAMAETPSGKATMVFLRRGTAGAAEEAPAVSTPFANEEAEACLRKAKPWKRHPLYLSSRVIQQSLF